jgi:hypothetical protein
MYSQGPGETAALKLLPTAIPTRDRLLRLRWIMGVSTDVSERGAALNTISVRVFLSPGRRRSLIHVPAPAVTLVA